jgi:hypothetical protein
MSEPDFQIFTVSESCYTRYTRYTHDPLLKLTPLEIQLHAKSLSTSHGFWCLLQCSIVTHQISRVREHTHSAPMLPIGGHVTGWS